ncbi:hypothetical protein VSR34_28180 [Paraburkholderia sp. JHI2823]|uniref:hypothetical protein n=1 Tax=Paraburkholderia TaxID=1822464 RepID=UPI000401476E|nr:hypothetical protein [Paraburkholderia mimosarum]
MQRLRCILNDLNDGIEGAIDVFVKVGDPLAGLRSHTRQHFASGSAHERIARAAQGNSRKMQIAWWMISGIAYAFLSLLSEYFAVK